MKKVMAYVRVSTVKQGERGSSLQEQRAAIDRYAQRNDLMIVRWFEELETAAKRGRRVFGELLKALSREEAEGVVIHKIDRSARNLRDWADLGDLIDGGVEVHFAHESIDLRSRGGRLSADIQAVVAADFIRNLREEVRKGLTGRLKQGLYPFSAPIGYLDKGGGLPKVPDPVAGPLVRRAFELYATGRFTLNGLQDHLHRVGFRNRAGGPISESGMSTILNNTFYFGLIRIRATGQVFDGVHEPLISKTLFDQTQRALNGFRRTAAWKHDFLYRRELRCEHCDYALIGERQKGHVYYRCHTKSCPGTALREDAIDYAIREALARLTLSELELREVEELFELKASAEHLIEADLVKSAELRLSQIEERLNRLTDAFLEGNVDKSAYDERRTRLLEERISARQSVEAVRSGQDSISKRARIFLELMKAIRNKAEIANSAQRLDLVKGATSNLRVDQKQLVFAWSQPFDVLAASTNLTDGGPKRGVPRTLIPGNNTRSHRKRNTKAARGQLALRLWDSLQSTTTSPHPHVPRDASVPPATFRFPSSRDKYRKRGARSDRDAQWLQ